jgi:hypothetical protein
MHGSAFTGSEIGCFELGNVFLLTFPVEALAISETSLSSTELRTTLFAVLIVRWPFVAPVKTLLPNLNWIAFHLSNRIIPKNGFWRTRPVRDRAAPDWASGLCLAGLLPGSGQDRIDCTQRESGTLRDFSRSDSGMPI